jgi:polar amino acid transport system substrate-binding protein
MAYATTIQAESHSNKPINVRLISSPFAPLQSNPDKPEGYVIDLFKALRPELKSKHNIALGLVEFYPWKRAMQIASLEKNTLFFSLSRTPDREKAFKWIAEVSPYKQAIFSLSNPNASVTPYLLTSWQELLQSNRILGVQSGSHLESYVTGELAIPERQVSSVHHYLLGINMLFAGRIDYMPLTSFLANGTLCKSGFSSDRLELNFDIDEFANPLWAAFNPKTDDNLVGLVQQEMLKITKSSQYKTRQLETIAKWNTTQCDNLALKSAK